MRLKMLALCLSAFALIWAAQDAQGGVIRSTGKQIGKGSAAVAQTTSDTAQFAVGGAATVGKTTGGALATGAAAAGKGVAATPGLAYHGSKAAAKKIWKAIW
jgi:hypothetical protein